MPKRPQPEDPHGRAERTALFRYQLIARLLDPELPPEERRAWQDWITAQEHVGPDGQRRRVSARTLRRWVALYRLGQFKGIQPPPGGGTGEPPVWRRKPCCRKRSPSSRKSPAAASPR